MGYCKIVVLFLSVGVSCALEPICRTEPDFTSACKFRNLTLVTYTGLSVTPDRCGSRINITQLSQPPRLYINTKNASDVFTVLMLDAGPSGTGPYYLHWLLSNLTSQQLGQKIFGSNNIPAYYQPPSLPKNAGIHEFQIVAFRHNTTLRASFPEVHDVERRAFSMRHWLDDVYHRVKLCGPVAGIQIRTEYQEPTGTPSVPYVPPGAAPGAYPPAYPVPAGYPTNNNPYPQQPYPNPYPDNPQHPPAYFPHNTPSPPKKKGNASLAKPASIIILSLVIFASVMI